MENDGECENWRDVTLDLEHSPTKVKHSRSLIRNKPVAKKFIGLLRSPRKRRTTVRVNEVRHVHSIIAIFAFFK